MMFDKRFANLSSKKHFLSIIRQPSAYKNNQRKNTTANSSLSRTTLRRDAIRLWAQVKSEIIEGFANHNASILLTCDVWTAPHRNANLYLYLILVSSQIMANDEMNHRIEIIYLSAYHCRLQCFHFAYFRAKKFFRCYYITCQTTQMSSTN